MDSFFSRYLHPILWNHNIKEVFNMVRHILDWCDRTYEKSFEEEDERKGLMMAAKSGAVEGFVDAAAVWGSLLIACSVVGIVKGVIKK